MVDTARKSHPSWRIAIALVALTFGVPAGCASGGSSPYERLRASEEQLEIPDSERWGRPFDPCPDGADCAPGVDTDTLKAHSWVVVDDLRAAVGVGDERTIDLDLEVGRVLRGPFKDSTTGNRAWGEDVDVVQAVLDDGYEVWAGVYPDEPVIVYFLAFDSEGRFAGLGHGAATLVTVPVAEIIDGHSPPVTARTFLEELLGD